MLHVVAALMLMQQTTISIDSRSGVSIAMGSVEASDSADSIARSKRRLPAATPEQIASAYADAAARSLVARARQARDVQDSSILSYDANTLQRLSAYIATTRLGHSRLAYRYESSSHIRWARGVGASIEVTGRRAVSPLLGDQNGDHSTMSDMDRWESPVPYFPGRDALWVGTSVTHAEGSTDDLIHPLARGAEAYYVYESGDSLTIQLADSTSIRLHEVEVRPRKRAWNVIIGTLWFDVASGQLVRAAYKLAEPLDLDIGNATISGFAVEYGLRDGKYWLPRSQSIEGEVQLGFIRLPMRLEEEFTYNSVNVAAMAVSIPGRSLTPPLDTTPLKSLVGPARDSMRAKLQRTRDSATAAERGAECQATGSTIDRVKRYDGTLVVGISVPCDPAVLARSPTLPGSIFDADDVAFSDADRDALLGKVAGMLPPATWEISRPGFAWGFDLERYNRVEGLSSAILITQPIGAGVRLQAEPRFGFGDRVFDGELSIATDEPFSVGATGYRRLVAANDWGDPLNVGSSLTALAFGSDEGFYYRADGVELHGERDGAVRMSWRVFDEQQLNAPTRTNWSIAELLGSSGFSPAADIVADHTRETGAAARLTGSTGVNPGAWGTATDVRIEGASGGFDYFRGAGDLTVSHGVVGPVDGALTLSGGTTAGTVPVQRLWYLGGTYTVRGGSAGAMAGNAYWLTRAELGYGSPGLRPVLFGDVGWAGNRDAWRQVGRPMSGVGAGVSTLDGLIRLDLARGFYPVQQWRLSLYLNGAL